MSIVATEIDSIHGQLGQQRMIFYKCQDHLGAWHNYGPVITSDDSFDAEAHKAVVAAKVAAALAETEAQPIMES
jgi:hypothetical protein